VIRITRIEQIRHKYRYDRILALVFAKASFASWPEPIDIFPGLGFNETQLIWGNAYYWAVLSMQISDPDERVAAY
jgi:hypothetical protein